MSPLVREAPKRIPRPSNANKLARLIWSVVYIAIFRFSPTPLHSWRRLVLRLFGAKIGSQVVIYPSAKIWAPWNLTIAPGATVGWDCRIYNVAPIKIGRNAVISQHSYICTATHDLRNDFQLMVAPINVGANTWIATAAFIGPGVTIGEGAVVGACSVVTRSVEAWTIVAGNPACLLGKRPYKARNQLHAS